MDLPSLQSQTVARTHAFVHGLSEKLHTDAPEASPPRLQGHSRHILGREASKAP